MPMPFVSRELYERVIDELRRSEEERKRLLDLLLGKEDITPTAMLAEALPDPSSKEAEEMVDPITGRLTNEQIRRSVQRALDKKAGLR